MATKTLKITTATDIMFKIRLNDKGIKKRLKSKAKTNKQTPTTTTTEKECSVSETSASCAGDGCSHFRSLTLSHDSICKGIRMKHFNEYKNSTEHLTPIKR